MQNCINMLSNFIDDKLQYYILFLSGFYFLTFKTNVLKKKNEFLIFLKFKKI